MTSHRKNPWTAWLTCIVLVLLAAAAIRTDKQGQSARETPFTDLEKAQERFVFKTDGKPFTGVILERYPNGAVKSRTEVRDGLLHGTSQGWFANGTMQIQESFQNGVAHGRKIQWRENGGRLSEGIIVRGQFEGLFQKWHENGVQAHQIEMKSGKPHGVAKAWSAEGKLLAHVEMEQGRLVRTVPTREDSSVALGMAKP